MAVNEYDDNPEWVVALTVSNIFAFFSAYRFIRVGWLAEGMFLIFSGIVSVFYHIADSLDEDVWLTEAQWAILDFWLAFNALNLVAAFIAKFEGKYRAWHNVMVYTMLVVTLILVLKNKTSVTTFVANVGILVMIVAVKFAVVDRGLPKNLDWVDLTIAATLTGTALGLYITASNMGHGRPDVYWWSHTLWHIAVYSAPAFIVDVYHRGRRGIFWRKRKDTGEWQFVIWSSKPSQYEQNPMYVALFKEPRVISVVHQTQEQETETENGLLTQPKRRNPARKARRKGPYRELQYHFNPAFAEE